PHAPLREGGGEALLTRVAEEVEHRALLKIVVVALLLQLGENALRRLEAPVRQQYHVLSVIMHRVGILRIYDDRSVMAELFLKVGMAVVPVGAALADWEAVGEGFARGDARKTDAGHAVHGVGQ